MNTKKINSITALLIFVVMLFFYLLTAVSGIKFWDSSEIVTCAAIMGVPHPPGSPLLSLLGRVMTFIPFYDLRGGGFGDTAYRINIIAVLSGALTVMLSYLITVKLISRTAHFCGKPGHDMLIMFVGLIAAFLTGFSPQFMQNAVEIETYMPALMISMLAVFLALRWEEKKDDPLYLRYLFLAVYLIGLGIGIHLNVLLIVPTVFLIIAGAKPSWFSDMRLWGLLVLLGTVLFFVYNVIGAGLFIIFSALISILMPLFLIRLHKKYRVSVWKKTLLGIILCISLFSVGISVYPTIMIRASKSSAVNIGNPDNLERFNNYLARDQYGQGNMLKGMFFRNASAGYQFNYMYLRYLLQQFPNWGPSPEMPFSDFQAGYISGGEKNVKYEHVPVFLLILLLLGIYFHIKTDKKRFGMFFLYFLLSSAGLVLYLNMENPQVCERGYFYLGSFQIIMVWIGFGIYGSISFVRKRLSSRMSSPVTAAMIIVFITLIPSALNYGQTEYGASNNNRQNGLSADELAVNILESCEPDAILFTHGDNDTFPLWYAQNVDNVRPDIRVINLSLLNTAWYIKQLRDEGRTVTIALDDNFIDGELCADSFESFNVLRWTPEPKEVTMGGLTWEMPPAYTTGDKAVGFLTVSHYMTAHIIDTNNRGQPIYFSEYVEQSGMIGLYNHMSKEGRVYRLSF